MNILFLCCTYTIGGVNMVTCSLSKRFSRDGHNVSVFTFDGTPRGMEQRYDNSVHLYAGNGVRPSFGNVMAMRKAIKDTHTEIVINNWGMRPWYLLQIFIATLGLGWRVQVVSEYHSDPCFNGALMGVDMQLPYCHNGFKRMLLKFKRILIIKVTAFNFRLSYRWSKRFVLLSPSFIQRFSDYSGVWDKKKIRVIPNPITLSSSNQDAYEKKNEIIYVGQLKERLKRVSRVVDVWKELSPKHESWCLTMVGDGPETEVIKRRISTEEIERIELVGFQSPEPYYKRAKILLLTSESEGFGLVVVEGMQFGVVPVVYGSYSAVYDIIEDGKNGVIFPYQQKGFDAKMAASTIEMLMYDEYRLNRMSESAKVSSLRFSMDNISNNWYGLFEELKHKEEGTIS